MVIFNLHHTYVHSSNHGGDSADCCCRAGKGRPWPGGARPARQRRHRATRRRGLGRRGAGQGPLGRWPSATAGTVPAPCAREHATGGARGRGAIRWRRAELGCGVRLCRVAAHGAGCRRGMAEKLKEEGRPWTSLPKNRLEKGKQRGNSQMVMDS